MFTIEYTRDAAKALKSMPRTTAMLIMQKVSALAADPFASNNTTDLNAVCGWATGGFFMWYMKASW